MTPFILAPLPPSSEVDFNVSGMFAMPTHTPVPDSEPGAFDRRRPGSQGSEGESVRKDRYLSRLNPSLSLPPQFQLRPPPLARSLSRQEGRGVAVQALYVVADESITVTDRPLSQLHNPKLSP